MEKININNVFSIGYRCITDDFLVKINIRKYSSPFSYMVIDYKTVFNFIYTNFNKFLDAKYIQNNNKFYWCENIWGKNLFFHTSLLPDYSKSIILSDWDSVCIWNHHNLFTEGTTIMKRAARFKKILNNKPETMLLLCIDKIKEYEDGKIFYDYDFLNEFINKYNCHLLFLVPLHNYNKEPELIVNSNNIKIIYFDSYYEFNGSGMGDTRIKWDKVEKMILDLYNFNIDEKQE